MTDPLVLRALRVGAAMTDPLVLRALRVLIQCRLDSRDYLTSDTVAALVSIDAELTRELESKAVIQNVTKPPEFPQDVWNAFHHVWTWAVGKPGYDKNAFRDLEGNLLQMFRDLTRERI